MHVDSKTDMTAYDYKPEHITKIEPSPRFIDKALEEGPQKEKIKRDHVYNAERLRTAGILKRAQQERVNQGRMYSHVKLHDLQNKIQQIRDNETLWDSQIRKTRSTREGIFAPTFEIDDTFDLPVGTQYDATIKEKAEQINNLKYINNDKMDELVEQLGYIDYRDALACNKYILEAKRSNDYHQLARAKVLEYALRTMSNRKRDKLEQSARSMAQEAGAQKQVSREKIDQNKLEILMKERPEVSEMMQDELFMIRQEKEEEEINIDRIHNRVDDFKDVDKMRNKKKSNLYDLKDEAYATEDDILSTELSENGDNDIYRKYKIIHQQEEMLRVDREAKEKELLQTRKKQITGLRGWNEENWEAQMKKWNHKKYERKKWNVKFESRIGHIRMIHEAKKLNFASFIHEDKNDRFMDRWAAYLPAQRFTQEQMTDARLPSEIRKLMAIIDLKPEQPNMAFPIHDENSAQTYKDINEIAEKYYEAKYDHYVDRTLRKLKFSSMEYDREWAEDHDKDMTERCEIMYSYDDITNDRHILRNRFLNEMNKKTTLRDIGAKLDEFILDSKANNAAYFHIYKTPFEVPKAATRDQTTADFDWKLHMLAQFDPIRPLWIDDQSQLNDDTPREKEKKKEIIAEIEFNDSRRQHDTDSLTPDEKTEIALFHSMKQDPFYKHHLRNFLSQFNEQENNNVMNYGSGKGDLDANDFIKFDRINLFDFRRMLPTKERSDNIDKNARAWGYGKRKTARAMVNVKPGTGKVTINGQPMHLYFHLPSQRFRILKPLMQTGYTALLDVNIHLHGGGFTGQCEACIPAIAKALQRFDVNTRPTLKSMGFLKTDSRIVERKKIGLIKARKGPTYVRR